MVKATKVTAIDSPGKQSPRLIKLVAGLCIGQIVMGIVTTTIVGVIVDRHVEHNPLFFENFHFIKVAICIWIKLSILKQSGFHLDFIQSVKK